jgi:hypothetical protein
MIVSDIEYKFWKSSNSSEELGKVVWQRNYCFPSWIVEVILEDRVVPVWSEKLDFKTRPSMKKSKFFLKKGLANATNIAKKLKEVECDQCDGCGWYEGGPTLKTLCKTCNGTGKI